MEQENKKLEQALAAGDGAKHSIEVDDSVASSTEAQDDDSIADKPPVIEMVRPSLSLLPESLDDRSAPSLTATRPSLDRTLRLG